jgi:hypothetical protein
MSGFLTHERIWEATTFVDHVSDYIYVHLMKNFTIEETLSAKKAFERIFTLAGQRSKLIVRTMVALLILNGMNLVTCSIKS